MAVAASVDALEQPADQLAGSGRGLIGIGDAQAATDVEVGDAGARPLDFLDQVEQAVDGLDVRAGVGDLRADVAVDADDLEAGQGGRTGIGRHRVPMGDAELRRPKAGRDVGMRLRVDVGVDAQADPCSPAARGRHARQHFHLADAFDVEAHHAGFERALHLRAGLADAGKDDARRVSAHGQHPLELAPGNDVEAAALRREPLQHRQARIGLHCIADEVVAAGKCVLVRRQRALHRRLRVDVERRVRSAVPDRRRSALR